MTRRPSHTQMRTCAGCRETAQAVEMIRWFADPDTGFAMPDWTGRSARFGGRGAWTHPTERCVRAALDGGFARAWKMTVRERDGDLLVERARTAGLRVWHDRLGLALRARVAFVGQRAAAEAMTGTRGGLLLVAGDAGDASRRKFTTNAGRKDIAVVMHDAGSELASSIGREYVSVVFIVHSAFAEDLLRWAAALSEFPSTPLAVLSSPNVESKKIGATTVPPEVKVETRAEDR